MTYANPLLHKPSRALPGRVVVIGAGTIGPDIGYYLKSAIPELTLHLVDVAQAPLDHAVERFKNYAQKAVERGKMSEARARRVTENLHTSLDYSVARQADWVARGSDRGSRAQTQDFRADRGTGTAGHDHHLKHQLATCRTHLQRTAAQGTGDGYPLLRPRLAQSDR